MITPEFRQALEEVMRAMQQRATIDRSAPWLRELERAYPEQLAAVKWFLRSNPPQRIVALAKIFFPNYAHLFDEEGALQWLDDLRNKLVEEAR